MLKQSSYLKAWIGLDIHDGTLTGLAAHAGYHLGAPLGLLIVSTHDLSIAARLQESGWKVLVFLKTNPRTGIASLPPSCIGQSGQWPPSSEEEIDLPLDGGRTREFASIFILPQPGTIEVQKALYKYFLTSYE